MTTFVGATLIIPSKYQTTSVQKVRRLAYILQGLAATLVIQKQRKANVKKEEEKKRPRVYFERDMAHFLHLVSIIPFRFLQIFSRLRLNIFIERM